VSAEGWRSWQTLGSDAVTFGSDLDPGAGLILESIAAGPNGLVAVGYSAEGRVGEVWHSLDGGTWTRIDVSALVGLGALPYAVAAGPDGYVAVGHDRAGGSQGLGAALILRSPNGIAWERISDDGNAGPTLDQLVLEDVMRSPSGFVAVGRDAATASALVLGSPDGIVWERRDAIDVATDAGMLAVASTTEGGSQLLGVGFARRDGSNESAWWQSDDAGVTWQRLADTGPSNVADGRFLGIAGTETATAVLGSGTSAGSLRRGSSLWFYNGGDFWVDLVDDDPMFQGAILTSVVAVEPTLLVLGVGCVVPPTGGACVSTPAVWGTDDGATWEVHTVPVSDDDDVMRALARVGDGYVAVGSSSATSPTFWRSR